MAMITSFADFNKALIHDLRAHGGKATSGPFKGRDVLILTAKGAKSGEVRSHPLVYSRDNAHYVIVASKGGAATNPAWYHNLVVNPTVTVEVLDKKFQARASVVHDNDEYERLYGQHAERMPAFNEYRKNTTRKIPVIVLEPITTD